MDRRLMWIDCETTGLHSVKCGIIQLAILVEDENGEVVDKLSLRMKPFADCVYEPKALEINKTSIETIGEYEPESEAMGKFLTFIIKHSITNIRYSFAGYNTQFDMKFVQQLFRRNTKHRYDYFFNYYDVDVYSLVKILDLVSPQNNKKLGGICELMNVKLDNAHDAMSDIKATRKLYKKIMKRYFK